MARDRCITRFETGTAPFMANAGFRCAFQNETFIQLGESSHAGESVDFEGAHLRARSARLMFPPLQVPHPPVYLGGSSPEALDLAAAQVDVYLTWGEPPAAVREKIAEVKRRAAALGRRVRFGIRLHVIVRDSQDAAWKAANDLISKVSDATIARAQAALANTDS